MLPDTILLDQMEATQANLLNSKQKPPKAFDSAPIDVPKLLEAAIESDVDSFKTMDRLEAIFGSGLYSQSLDDSDNERGTLAKEQKHYQVKAIKNMRVMEECKKVFKKHCLFIMNSFHTLACQSKYPFVSREKIVDWIQGHDFKVFAKIENLDENGKFTLDRKKGYFS